MFKCFFALYMQSREQNKEDIVVAKQTEAREKKQTKNKKNPTINPSNPNTRTQSDPYPLYPSIASQLQPVRTPAPHKIHIRKLGGVTSPSQTIQMRNQNQKNP